MIRRISLLFLLLIPMPVLTFAYEPGKLERYITIALFQGLLIAGAAWLLVKRKGEGDRTTLAAACLLVANWIVTSMALNMNTPPTGQAWLSTLPDQQFRYHALAAGGLIALGGLALLAARLYDAGERTLPVLAVTAAMVSHLLFTVLMISLPHAATARYQHAEATQWWTTVGAVFSSLGVVQRYLLYCAVILFAVSLRRAGWLGRMATASLVSLTALAAVANSAVHFPPAVPFILPYLAGVLLLFEMGPRQEVSMASNSRFRTA